MQLANNRLQHFIVESGWLLTNFPRNILASHHVSGRKQALMEGTHVVSSGYISLKRSVQLRVPVIREKPLKTGYFTSSKMPK